MTMMTRTLRTRRKVAIGMCSLATLFGSCGGGTDDTSADQFWNSLVIAGEDAEPFESIDEMAVASDAVVLGRLSGPGRVRVIQGDAPEDQVFVAQLKMTISSAGRGEPGKAITVEFLLPAASAADAEHMVADLVATAPVEDMVLYARSLKGVVRGDRMFRPVNSNGVWVERSGTLVAPLAGDGMAVDGTTSLTGLIDRAAAGS
jgi:hypothetical protein